MKVALLVHNLKAKDGWSRYAVDLGKTLAERGHEIHCLVHERTDDTPWCTQHACLRPPLHALSLVGIALQWYGTWRALRTVQPDISHVICEPYALLLACIPKREKRVITLHGSYAVIPFRSGRIVRLLWERALRTALRIVTVSAFTKHFLLREEPAFSAAANLEQKIVVIHNALRLEGIDRAHRDPAATPKVIISVGAVKRRKGYVHVMHALAAFKERSSIPFLYELIGSLSDAKEVAAVRDAIRLHGLEREVRLRGIISEEELRSAYARADLFLMLSVQEGLHVEGFVLGFIEAAARGIPCIGPNTGGCPEAISEGKSGYVCAPDHPEDVAEAMEKVLGAHTIDAAACRAWAEAHDMRSTVAAFEAIYQAS